MEREELRRWMRRQKVSQAALAKALGVHLTTVNRWCRGTAVARGGEVVAVRVDKEGKRIVDQRSETPKPLALPKWLPIALGLQPLQVERKRERRKP